MSSTLANIETLVRQRIVEPKPKFWSSVELLEIEVAGIKDLWRDVVDLKQEHYLTVNTTDVSLLTNGTQLVGLPGDIHKVYLIEGRFIQSNQVNVGLQFSPLDYNHRDFQLARSRGGIDPTNDTIYYCISGQGGPVSTPIIYCAPTVTSDVAINFSYVPTLPELHGDDLVPVPGEADNALVAWTVAYARAKEREDRSPDPAWLAIYGTEKQHLLQSLGLRQYQEPQYAEAVFREYWGLLIALAGLSSLVV